MYIQEIKDKKRLDEWVKEMNLAFKTRSSEKIPYERMEMECCSCNQTMWGLYSDEGVLLGGMCLVDAIEYGNIKLAKLNHVWVSVHCQRGGVGTILMKEAEKIALGAGREMLQLNVANIYMPAVSLYKKSGFKKIKIYANVPNTYYFIRMIKPIGTFRFCKRKRICSLVTSAIVFRILFKQDSTPTILNKIIYGRKENS